MNLNHGKYLGVDYGDVRTGLAECDISGMLASGIGTIAEGGMRKTAERVAKEQKPKLNVFGHQAFYIAKTFLCAMQEVHSNVSNTFHLNNQRD